MRLLILLLLISSVSAANHYVRQGANGNGNDWEDAYDSLPSSLVRGDNYYIADGSYSSYNFDDTETGQQWITIKKATLNDHGTDAGWHNSYGDGQAVFGSFSYDTGYYEIDGKHRNEDDWQDVNSYGFKIDTTIWIEPSVSYLTHKYIDLGGDVGTIWPNVPDKGVAIQRHGTPWREHLVFSRMHIHNIGIAFHSRSNNHVTIEYSHIGPSFGKEAISHQYGHNWIIRNNKFIDSCANPQAESCTAIIGVFNFCGTCDPADVQADNFEISGNVFASVNHHESHNDAIILGSHVQNWKIYNNNLVNLGYRVDGISLSGSGNKVYNTLWAPVGLYDDTSQNSAPVWCSANICENLWCQQHPLTARSYMSCNKLQEEWPTTVVSENDPFVDWRNLDFRMKDPSIFGALTPVDAGKNLDTEYYQTDAYGNIRGADGNWDIGAYEFTSQSDCDQTLTPGANIIAAVSSAPAGSTICLNDGDYGTVNLWDISRNSYVTLISVNSKKATLYASVGNSDFIRLKDLTVDGTIINSCSTNIQILDSKFTGSMTVRADGCSPDNNLNILIDGNTFEGLGTATWEGRLSIGLVGSDSGITISNNVFGGGGCSDGIQLVGGAGRVQIGPGNIFRDLVQGSCGEHVDAIQFYGAGPGNIIEGNYFYRNTVHIGTYDGGDSITVKDNVFDTPHDTGYQALQLGGIQGMLMEHNTFKETQIGVGTKSANSQHTGWVVQNNIFDNSDFNAAGDQPGCGDDCIVQYNLLSNGGSIYRDDGNNVVGNAVYKGTASVSNWAGWQLASGSPGKNAGNDGKDMGTTYFGDAFDLDCSINQLILAIDDWKNGLKTIEEVMHTITSWKSC